MHGRETNDGIENGLWPFAMPGLLLYFAFGWFSLAWAFGTGSFGFREALGRWDKSVYRMVASCWMHIGTRNDGSHMFGMVEPSCLMLHSPVSDAR